MNCKNSTQGRFLRHFGYKQKGNSEIDLALLKNGEAKVIIEAKRQGSKEMISAENVNCKALHEAILYYLRQKQRGSSVKFIIITDFYEFCIFRYKSFEDCFCDNKEIKEAFVNLSNFFLIKTIKRAMRTFMKL